MSLDIRLQGNGEGDLTTSDVGIAQQSQGVVLHGRQALMRCRSPQFKMAQDG